MKAIVNKAKTSSKLDTKREKKPIILSHQDPKKSQKVQIRIMETKQKKCFQFFSSLMSKISEHVAMIENQPIHFDNMSPLDYLTLKSAFFDNENTLELASIETDTFKKGLMTLAYQRNLDNYRLKKYNERIQQIIIKQFMH